MVILVRKQGSDMSLPLKEADLCLLFNSDVYNGHYSAICMDDQLLLITEKVTHKEGYRKELDVEWERGCRPRKWALELRDQELGAVVGVTWCLLVGSCLRVCLWTEFADKVRTFVESQQGRGTGGGTGGVQVQE